MLKKTGYNPVNVKFVLMSAHRGSNIVDKPSLSPCYQNRITHDLMTAAGNITLLEAIQALRTPKRPIGKPLRIPIDDVHRIGGVGRVVCGRVVSG